MPILIALAVLFIIVFFIVFSGSESKRMAKHKKMKEAKGKVFRKGD
jgi:preprotein translocase subunit YajC